MCVGHLCDYNLNNFEVKAISGSVKLDECKLFELKSIW